MGCKKQGAKKQGHCYSKREEAFSGSQTESWVQIDWATVFVWENGRKS